MLSGIYRVLAVLIIGAVTAFPEWGLAPMAWKLFPLAPIPVTIGALIWAVVLALALPFSLRVFRYTSTVSVIGVCAIGIYQASQIWTLDGGWWAFVGILVAFFAFGWWKAATPLWRWANGIVAVQQAGGDHEHHN